MELAGVGTFLGFVGFIWGGLFLWAVINGTDKIYLENNPHDVYPNSNNRTYSSRPTSQKISIILFSSMAVIGTSLLVYDKFFGPPTEAEIAEKQKREEIQKEKNKLKELDFISLLGKNAQNIENINFKELALKHIKETELQNDVTEKRLMDKYIRVTGKVSDIDTRGNEYGLPEFMIQLVEGKEAFGTIIDGLYVTGANCYATNENEKNKISNASIGSELTIVGKVASYGDMAGLILNYCTVE